MTTLEIVLLAGVTLAWIAATAYRARAILNSLEHAGNGGQTKLLRRK